MTAASGDPGEKPDSGPFWTPPAGGQEAPPIEQMLPYGGYPAGPGYPGPGGFPPPGQAEYGSYPPPYPAPGYSQQYPPAPGYPPPGYHNPYQGGYGMPAAEPGTNPLAIFSLVASVIGLLCGIGSVIGIVLGAVALNQIKVTRQGGYGLAVAGIVAGVASLIISVVWIVYTLN